MGLGLLITLPHQLYPPAQRPHSRHLDVWGGGRHADDGVAAQAGGGQSHTLHVVRKGERGIIFPSGAGCQAVPKCNYGVSEAWEPERLGKSGEEERSVGGLHC